MSLNPDGVFSLGLKIGRRSADLILMNFIGDVRVHLHEAYSYPTPRGIVAFVEQGTQELRAAISAEEWAKIAGLGIAMPFELWNWVEAAGAPRADMEAWRDADIADQLSLLLEMPTFLQNDATAACAAELAFGHGPRFSDFAYFFIGSFIGGGVVLNHALFPGRTGNAGAFGSMPFLNSENRVDQLINHASVVQLEKMVIASGKDASSIWLTPESWDDFGEIQTRWIAKTAKSLAYAIAAACSVIDFEAVIIDGGFGADVRTRLVQATLEAVDKVDFRGIARPIIVDGIVGATARAVGAGSLPLFSRYHIDQTVLFKETT